MAFSYNTLDVISLMRISYRATTEGDETAHGFVKPIGNDVNGDQVYPQFVPPESPPITLQIARHFPKGIEKNMRDGRDVSQEYPKSLDFDKNTLIDDRKVQRKGRNNSSKAYRDNDTQSLDSMHDPFDKDLDLIEEEEGVDDSVMANVDEELNNAVSFTETDAEVSVSDDAVTIDSDFGVPVNGRGKVVDAAFAEEKRKDKDRRQSRVNNKRLNDIETLGSNNAFKENTASNGSQKNYDELETNDEFRNVAFEEGFYEDEEDDEEEEEEDDEVYTDDSSDSAFTEIETDSMLTSSMLLDDLGGVTESSLSLGVKDDHLEGSKRTRKKKRKDSIDVLSSSGRQSTSASLRKLLISGLKNDAKSTTSLSLSPIKREGLTFEKQEISKEEENHESSLTSMIKSKFKNTDSNPLAYFNFVGDETNGEGRKTSIKIFLPEVKGPVFKLEVNDNISVANFIGFILLNLFNASALKDRTVENMNPNNWRLELVDEDGINYGSFGVLNRTRLLSSYNNPEELAICKVTDVKEREKNEQESSLPQELRMSLSLAEKPSPLLNNLVIEENPTDFPDVHQAATSLELKIILHPSCAVDVDYVRYYAYPDTNIAALQQRVCDEFNLDGARYVLGEISPKESAAVKGGTLLQRTTMKDTAMVSLDQMRIVKLSEVVSDLQSTTLELLEKKEIPLELLTSSSSMINNVITPSEGMPSLSVITPQSKQLDDTTTPDYFAATSSNTITKPKGKEYKKNVGRGNKSVNLNKVLDDMLAGRNDQLPTNINTIYFKWKVWRKKATILNKIEKTLVIDGDYIHLTPSADQLFTTQNGEYSFIGNGTHGQSQHHHLNHYNYSHYYKKMMAKTSSFHITQIIKIKQYKDSKNPNHFKIIVTRPPDPNRSARDSKTRKKYDLEASSRAECEEIVEKINWATQMYKASALYG